MDPASEPKLDHLRRVAIGGESFGVRSDAPPETIERVARLVDERLQKARELLGETDRFRAAVLASLQVAGDLIEARQELDTLRAELSFTKDRLAELVQKLSEN